MLNLKYAVSFLFVFSSILFSQEKPDWIRNFNSMGNHIDLGVSGTLDDNGNICVLASTEVFNSVPKNFLVLKYNPQGELLWSDVYNGTGNDIDDPIAIAADHLGNTYVTGNSVGVNSHYDIVLIKYNSNGVRQWVYR